MNREKWLFLIVLVIVLAWGGLRLTSAYEAQGMPSGRSMQVTVPEVKDVAGLAEEKRFTKRLAGVDALAASLPERGRTMLVPFSDLERLEPILLPVPRDLPTPIVLPPLPVFPGVAWFRWFRAPGINVVAAAAPPDQPTEPDAGTEPAEEEDETDADRAAKEESALASRQKWTFRESEWDCLLLVSGSKWFGTVSMLKGQTEAGHTKFDLLLPENATLEFYFEQIETATGKVQTTGTMSREKGNVRDVIFADKIENRYWAKRITDRVKPNDVEGLLALGRWVMDLAELPSYSRPTGLELAAQTFAEAMKASGDSVEAVLAWGEALHRSFRFDEEMAAYDKSFAAKPAGQLQARRARLFRKLGLPDLELDALDQALALAPGDVQSRLYRGNARLAAGRVDEAAADFSEAEKSGTTEEQLAGREGRARTLLARGKAKDVVTLLASATDAASLVTLGAAHYALKSFAEAEAAFAKAINADTGSELAWTCHGMSLALTATDANGLEKAITTLETARWLPHPNPFYPPLGQAWALARLGKAVDSQDRFITAAKANPADAYVRYALGASYVRDGRFADAREEFLKALKLDYRFADALLGAGTASMQVGDWSKARMYLDRALSLELRALADAAADPAHQAAAKEMVLLLRFRLGRAWLLSEDAAEKDRLGKAKEHFTKLLELDNRFVPALMGLGVVFYQEGDVDEALKRLDLARDLAPAGSEERQQAEDLKQRIVERENQRLWHDSFDRPNSRTVGNGWAQIPVGAIQPMIRDGKVQVTGRMEQQGTIWLMRGERAGLNDKFISTQAVVTTGKSDRADVWFVVFQRRGGGAGTAINVGSTVGVGRNTPGQVEIIERKPADKEYTRTVVKNPDGTPMLWPEGEVVLRIERIDPEEGVFALWLNGERIGTSDVGLRRRGGEVEIGFLITANGGEQIDVTFSGVEMVRYK